MSAAQLGNSPQLDALAGIVLTDVEATQTRLADAQAQLSALSTGLVALRETLGGEVR